MPVMLTGKQYEIVRWLAEGLTDRQIAVRLGLSVRTVSNTLARLYDRTGVSSRAHLAGQLVSGHVMVSSRQRPAHEVRELSRPTVPSERPRQLEPSRP